MLSGMGRLAVVKVVVLISAGFPSVKKPKGVKLLLHTVHEGRFQITKPRFSKSEGPAQITGPGIFDRILAHLPYRNILVR